MKLRHESRWKLLYFIVFYLRRFIFVIVLVFLSNYKSFQILVINIQAILVFMYVALINPYQSKFMNRIEKFNEIITILTLDFLFTLTDFTMSAHSRTANGWFIISLFYFQVIVNIGFISVSLGKFYRLKVFKRYFGQSLKTV